MHYSAEEQAEISRNGTGKLIWISSIGLLLIACFCFNGGSAAVTIGVLGMIGFGAGFFITMGNRSREQIDELHRNAQIQVDLMVKMAKAGMSSGEISDRVCAMNHPKHTSDDGTKEIIKGAVVGGIIAGDAGAVVGATLAKNKLDNAKETRMNH